MRLPFVLVIERVSLSFARRILVRPAISAVEMDFDGFLPIVAITRIETMRFQNGISLRASFLLATDARGALYLLATAGDVRAPRA